MRVERFFLFFGPTIWSFKRGETEYGVKAIPLGGYVKISGMNPEEEVLPEVDHRAYYRQPVWKRIVVIGAGPGGQHRPRLRDPLRRLLLSAQQVTRRSASRAETPAARVSSRRQDRRRRRQAPTRPGPRRPPDRFGKIVASHECAGKQVDGCLAATPVTLKIERDGELKTISVRPEYDKEASRP